MWMGAGFAEKSFLVFSIITFSGLIASQTTVSNLIISGLGYSRLIGFFGLLAVVCYTLFLPILTREYGIVGASVGMLLTTLINVFFVFNFTTRKMDIKLLPFLITTFGFHLIPVILSLICFVVIHLVKLENSMILFCIGCVLVALYYWIMIKKDILPVAFIMSRLNARV
jgi:O-antigen/teichoic acid export membrane protein